MKPEVQSKTAEPPEPPAGSLTAEPAIAVKSITAVTYTPIFVGGIPKAVTNVELQEVFRTDDLVGRYYRKGNGGFAKILVPYHELDRVLS